MLPQPLRLAGRGLATLLALHSFVSQLPAQDAAVARVRFANRTPAQHRGWAQATVPFAQGVYTPAKSYGVAGHRSELIPFGAPWPDGSFRYGNLTVRLDQPAWSETVLDVVESPPDRSPFVWSPWLAAGIQNFGWEIAVGVPRLGVRRAGLKLIDVPFASGIRTVFHFRDRIADTGLVYDLWLTARSDQDSLEFELRVTSSSPRLQVWHEDVEWVELWTRGGVPFVRGAARRGVLFPSPPSGMGPNRLLLLGPTRIYDGQGHEWWGDFVCFHPQVPVADRESRAQTLLANLIAAPYGCALDWQASGAFGPFGVVPPPPPWITDGGRSAALAMRARYEQYLAATGKPWDDLPLGMFAKPGTTGDQPDFGVTKLGDIFASGMPDRIEEARFMAGEEANRPVHHRELDGDLVDPSMHPNWVAWGGRTHFNSTVSPDRLGKPQDEPYLDANGWLGRDHQHWSSLTLASTYLLTGSWSLRHELHVEANLYLAGHTTPSMRRNLPTNLIDEPRAVGRTFLSMAWNWLCTGRSDLRTRMLARVHECVHPQHLGLIVGGAVMPQSVTSPDPRTIGKYVHWKPWEEAIAVVGLEAVYQVTGDPIARGLAIVTARNTVNYGWKVTPNETIIATGVTWNPDGSPLTAAEYADPEKVLWSYGAGYNVWALPATKLTVTYARLLGDTTLEQRAAGIVAAIHASRVKPFDGLWDRFADWEAVR